MDLASNGAAVARIVSHEYRALACYRDKISEGVVWPFRVQFDTLSLS
jgi:hypothetical protein